MPISGKLEITIKINELPQAATVENNWKEFEVDCDGRLVVVRVKPKMWSKLETAASSYPMWVAAISGKLGEMEGDRILLDSPNIQVFEKKPKPEAEAG